MPQNVAEKKPETSELTPKQAAGLVALLSSPTVTAAAKLAKVDRKTLQRWMHLPIFRQAIREAESKAMDRVGLRLANGTDAALKVLADLITKGPDDIDYNRRLAADGWIDHFYKHWELHNLQEQIQEIREALSRSDA